MKWLPIETAPKDGSIIFVCSTKFGYWIRQVRWVDRPRVGYWEVTVERRRLRADITHWMPLPEPPSDD